MSRFRLAPPERQCSPANLRMARSTHSSAQNRCGQVASEDASVEESAAQNMIPTAPYPARQILILALCRLSEPIAMTSSFPYLFFMIRDFHVIDSEKGISRYAGILASSFSFAQVFSGTFLHPVEPPWVLYLTCSASVGMVLRPVRT